MGSSLRIKIMSGVLAMLAIFAAALVVTLYLVHDSGEEVAGIVEYHNPIVARLNALDVYTYEIEIIAYELTNGMHFEAAEEKARLDRSQELDKIIDTIFVDVIQLAEAASNDARNDLSDRLAFARLVGTIRSLQVETKEFTNTVFFTIKLASEKKFPEARASLVKIREFERLDPVFERIRKKSNELVNLSLAETDSNIFNIIWMNIALFAFAAVLGFFVFLFITGRLQTAFRLLTSAFHQTAKGHFSAPLPVTSSDEIGELTGSFNQMVEQLKSKEKLREAFGHFLDPRIVANVVNPLTGELRQSAERRRVTIFFSDISGFSAIGEQLTADTLVHLLNRYFTAATEVIRHHHGIVDKFIGDAVMAFWASPFSDGETHARDACLACLDMRASFAKIQEDLSQITGLRRNVPRFQVRMALATGETIIGTVGSDTTKSFTVIGDTVNIASRLEGVNKIYGTDLIINEDCFRLAENEVEVRELDLVTVYGKTEPVRIYELLSKTGELDTTTALLRDAFATALQHYRHQKWSESEEGLRMCLKIRENDGPSLEFLTRIATFSRTPPPKDWNGIWQTASK
ncbi:MAG: HAMP domain-containing protein [Verrucomicrobia bacterium]|nr:HAMP domain-containing protein [Verrucomicrobiota bacterium]